MSLQAKLGTATESESLGREFNMPLGKYPGSELARRISRTVNPVQSSGQKSCPASVRPRAWTEAEIKLLGTRPDKEIAQLLKRHVTTVGDRRRELGIPHFVGNRREWTLEEERLLGTMPDKQLAHRVGRTLFSIRSKRLREGKPFYHWWTPSEERLLGGMLDEAVARRTGRTVRGVQLKRQRERILHTAPRRRKWTRKEEQLLGTWADADVARLVGRSVSAVEVRRRHLRIPQYTRTARQPDQTASLAQKVHSPVGHGPRGGSRQPYLQQR